MKAYARARRLLEGTGSATGSALGPSNSSPTDSEIREVPNFLWFIFVNYKKRRLLFCQKMNTQQQAFVMLMFYVQKWQQRYALFLWELHLALKERFTGYNWT